MDVENQEFKKSISPVRNFGWNAYCYNYRNGSYRELRIEKEKQLRKENALIRNRHGFDENSFIGFQMKKN